MSALVKPEKSIFFLERIGTKKDKMHKRDKKTAKKVLYKVLYKHINSWIPT